MYVEGTSTEETEFATIPKDLVVEQSSLSTILRNEHRGVSLEDLPDYIFLRNDLDGTLEITHSTEYGAADKTRAGQPKEGWRLVFMVGCHTFMDKLSKFPAVSYTHLTLPTIYSV